MRVLRIFVGPCFPNIGTLANHHTLRLQPTHVAHINQKKAEIIQDKETHSSSTVSLHSFSRHQPHQTCPTLQRTCPGLWCCSRMLPRYFLLGWRFFSPQKTSPETNFLDMFRESICSLQKEKTQFLPAPCIERKKRPKASEKIIKELQIIQSQQRVSSSAELLTVATKVLLNSKVAAINKACPKALVSFCCSKISSQLSKCNGNKTSRI